MEHDETSPKVEFDKPTPWQFSLRSLMLWLFVGALLSLPLAYLPYGGMALTAILTGGCFVAFLVFYRRITFVELLCLIAIIGIMAATFLPAVSSTGRRGPWYWKTHCKNNIKQIALALLMYEQAHGSFPPAYTADADGTPLHSWRVLILPYIEQQRLYDQYDFDEPWDGPNNSQLHGMMPV